MASKKKHKAHTPGTPSAGPKADASDGAAAISLSVGDYVRVRPGVMDPDFNDFPIAGWTGRVDDILDGKKRTGKTVCIVDWDRKTRRAMSAEFRARSEEEGMECTSMGLSLSDLERIRPPDAPEPGSLQDLMEQVEMGEEWPDPEILEAIVAKGGDAIEPLREIVRYGTLHPDDAPAAGVAAGLLGELQAQVAVHDLLQLLRQGDDEAMDWTVDALKAIGDIPLGELGAIIRDPELDGERRELAIDVFEHITDDRAEAEGPLVAILSDLLAGVVGAAKSVTVEGVELTNRIVHALLRLGAASARPLVDAALKAGLIDQDVVTSGEHAARYRTPASSRQVPGRTFLDKYQEQYEKNPEEDDEFECEWDDDEEDGGSEEWDDDEEEDADELGEPVAPVRVAEKVGRNDPCPCGSGKKFKKCCLGKSEAPPAPEPSRSSPAPEWQVEVELPPPKVPKSGTVELHPDVPRDLRRRLEQARLETIALLRTMDRAMVYLSPEEFPPELRAVFELEADCAEAQSLEGEDVSVVHEPLDDRRGDDRVSEDLAPLLEGPVAA
jgi:hypothetical protein